MRLLTLLLLISFSFPCFSQNNELLRSRGLLPKSVVGTSQQIAGYEMQKQRISRDSMGPDQLYLIKNTSELCEAIAKSGRLLVNDTLSAYANRILDILLDNDPILRSKLCVYFYYSEGTNAVTLYNGMIIIEMGLMAHVKNEAQLAFILSHEICHFRENHFLKTYRYSKARVSDDRLDNLLQYSRELEEEADSLGFILYKNSGYLITEASETFKMLKFTDRPEVQIPFDNPFFEHGLYKFPEEYDEVSVFEIPKTADEETLSTHPSCESRMENMKSMQTGMNANGMLFQLSQKTFVALRKIAREECCNLYLEKLDFGNAIYCAYQLLKEDSTNKIASVIMGKGLYNLSAYNVPDPPMIIPEFYIMAPDHYRHFSFPSDQTFHPIVDYTRVSGESQKLNFFLSRMNSLEMAVLALDWNWNVYRKGNYKDKLLEKLCKNLMEMIVINNKQSPADFYVGSKPGDKVQVSTDSRSYLYRGLDQLFTDTIFFPQFWNIINQPSHATSFPANAWKVSADNFENKGGLTMRDIAVLPPSYYILREIKHSRKFTFNRSKSEDMQALQQKITSGCARATGANYVALTPEAMDSNSIANYNTYCLLQQWRTEQNMHESNYFALNLSHAEVIDSLSAQTNIHYVMTSAIIHLTSVNQSKYQTLVYDLSKGTVAVYYDDIIKGKAGENQMIYYYNNVFKKLSRKKQAVKGW